MRRLALVPLLAIGLLAGCSQVAQIAGEAAGIPVGEICATADQAYADYESLLAQGAATEEQVDAARDGLVNTLEGLAGDVDGPIGDAIQSGADQLAGAVDLQSPETIEAIEQVKTSLDAFCG
ncbi:hypothetical protein ACWGJP_14770 [Microbacterium sp. NPDC055903]